MLTNYSAPVLKYLRQNKHIGTLDETQHDVIAIHVHHPASLVKCSLYINVANKVATTAFLLPLVGEGAQRADKGGNEQPKISQVKYKVYGCGVTIACLAWTAEFLESKNITEVSELTASDIIDALEIAPAKQHCAEMVYDMVKIFINKVNYDFN